MFFVALNIAISSFLVLVLKQGAWVLALSFSVTIIGNVIISLIVLYRKIGGYRLPELFGGVTKIVIATVCSAFPAYVLLRLLDSLIINTTRTLSLLLLMFVVGGVYLSGYLLLCWLLGVSELAVVTKLFCSGTTVWEKAERSFYRCHCMKKFRVYFVHTV
ncbi:MAG: hypothetical protein UZ21_OP11001000619 [Microgenomates bacterium OLB22]|nr:MAG: hypothetical protein UZ21_OP11001000619 [Microgenomates bacterium OLB22]